MEISKRNYIVFFYTYFAVNMVFIIVNVYLPVYFFNVLNVNRLELAFVQLFAYLSLFLRPLIAIYFDKERSNIRLVVIISSIGMFASFVLFILNLSLLIVFGIFLAIYFICAATIRVAIEKVFVSCSPDDVSKNRNSAYMQVGAITGALFPNVFAILFFTDIYSIPLWNIFFLVGIIAVFPIIVIGVIAQFNILETIALEEEDTPEEVQINKAGIILVRLILFCIYSENIYQYPLEPWILDTYGAENLTLILIFFGIVIIVNAVGVIVAGIFSNRFERTKVLFISSLVYGILLIIAPFTTMVIFFTLFAIMNFFSGFIIVNIMGLMNEYSQKKVVYYQIMGFFVILAIVIFVPVGTYLSSFIATEIIIVVAGVFRLISLIPILILINKRKRS